MIADHRLCTPICWPRAVEYLDQSSLDNRSPDCMKKQFLIEFTKIFRLFIKIRFAVISCVAGKRALSITISVFNRDSLAQSIYSVIYSIFYSFLYILWENNYEMIFFSLFEKIIEFFWMKGKDSLKYSIE